MQQTALALLKDKRGGVAVIAALTIAAVISFASLTLDSGLAYDQMLRQQTATDFAALSAAGSMASPSAAASTAATANGFGASTIASIETGIYTPDPTIAHGARFIPAATGALNAVRVTMQSRHHYLFGKLMGYVSGSSGPIDPMVVTRSVAATRGVAAFSLGSGTLSISNGVVNGVLSSLLGTSVSLSLSDYQSLASTSINLFAFSNALATRLGATAGTYNTLASTTVSLPDALAAAQSAGASTASSSALAALVSAAGTGTAALKLGTLINYGTTGTLNIATTAPLAASISAFDLVSALLQAANGASQVDTPLSISLPGVISASVKVVVGQPATGTSLIAVGAPGATLTTGQIRVRLTLRLVGTSVASVMTVPVVLNVGSGTAALTNVSCAAGLSTSSAQLGVVPGLVDAWIGTVSDADLAALAMPLNPPAATFVNLAGLVVVNGWAHASIANTTATPVPFSYAEVLAGIRKTVSTSDFLSPLVGSLLGSATFNTTVLGFIPISSSALNLAIGQTLALDAAPVDTILASVLGSLGLSLGNATVSVSAIQCGKAVLIN